MSKPTLTLHHLQRGQSERIIWLLEELQIPYNLELHKRDPLLSPPSLRAIHELGSAPVLIDGDLVMSESMAIATYILNKHASSSQLQQLAVEPSSPKYSDYLFWLYFVLCSLQPSGSTCMMAYFDKSVADDSPARAFPRARLQRNLGLIEKRLSEVDFLAGDRFSLADIMVIWVFTTFRVFLPYSLKPYPNILKYVGRITEREAYVRAMEKGDGGLPILKEVEPGEKKAVF